MKIAIHHAGMAKTRDQVCASSDDTAYYGVRDSVLLGRTHDHAWLPHMPGIAGGGDHQASRWENQTDSLPFRQVYIHWSRRRTPEDVEDEGNVVDPLDVIERFGTDATPFDSGGDGRTRHRHS